MLPDMFGVSCLILCDKTLEWFIILLYLSIVKMMKNKTSLQCILQECKYDASYYILNIRDHHADLLENEISEVILILKGWYFNGTRQDKRLKLLRNGISFCHIIDCIAMNEKISWSWENEKEWCSIWKIESSMLQGKIRD